MHTVNMLEAKSSLSRLVEAVVLGYEPEIIIARHGRAVAKLVPIDKKVSCQRIGIAKNSFEMPDSIDEINEHILNLFQQP